MKNDALHPPLILGICGLAGSGKDTVAKFLAEDLRFVGIAFADPLKQIAKAVYRFTDDQLWGPSQMRNAPDTRYPRPHGAWVDGKCVCCGVPNEPDIVHVQCYLTPRYALQLLGTEWGRQCFPDTWAAMGVATAKDLVGSSGGRFRYDRARGIFHLPEHDEAGRAAGVAITDVRFKNEIRIIREGGGKVVRVRRPGAGLGGSAGLHPSEVEQAGIPDDDFDAVLENDKTLEVLRTRALVTADSLSSA